MRNKTAEKNLWAWLKKGALGCEDISLHRIENTLARSTPDVVAAVGSTMFFIELKTTARPVRKTTPIRARFQQGQTNFLYYWALKHNSAFLLLQVGSGAEACRYMLRGTNARAVEAGELYENDLNTLALVSPTAKSEEILQYAAFKIEEIFR